MLSIEDGARANIQANTQTNAQAEAEAEAEASSSKADTKGKGKRKATSPAEEEPGLDSSTALLLMNIENAGKSMGK